MGKFNGVEIATPQGDKLAAVSKQSQAIGEFIDWMRAQGYVIAEFVPLVNADGRPIIVAGNTIDQLGQVPFSTEQILADYFEIDLDELEHERRLVLAALMPGTTVDADELREQRKKAGIPL